MILFLKLLKYEFLSKRKYLLIFAFVLFAFYFSIFIGSNIVKEFILGFEDGYKASRSTLDYENNKVNSPIHISVNITTENKSHVFYHVETLFNVYLACLIISLVIAFGVNVAFTSFDINNYLNFSLPIKGNMILYKRLVWAFLEFSFWIFLNTLLFEINLFKYNPETAKLFLNFLFEKGGILSLILTSFSLVYILLLGITFIAIPNIKSELKLIKYVLFIITLSYFVYGSHVNDFIIRLFPYKINLNIPRLDTFLSKGEYLPTSIFLVYFIIFLFYFFILSYVYKNQIEIKG